MAQQLRQQQQQMQFQQQQQQYGFAMPGSPPCGNGLTTSQDLAALQYQLPPGLNRMSKDTLPYGLGNNNHHQQQQMSMDHPSQATFNKEYETQMLKMSVLFDDGHSVDEQNLSENLLINSNGNN